MGDGARGPADLEPKVAKLLARSGRGDRQAMAEVFEATSGIVFALVLRIVGERPTAEDVLSEVYLQVWKTAERFDPQRGRAVGWLASIARSRAIDAIRRNGGRPGGSSGVAADVESKAPGPEESGFAAERQHRVRAALGDLSEAQRKVLELAYFQGYSQSQIAERLGQPLGTVKTRVRSAMKTLRQRLVDLDEREKRRSGADQDGKQQR